MNLLEELRQRPARGGVGYEPTIALTVQERDALCAVAEAAQELTDAADVTWAGWTRESIQRARAAVATSRAALAVLTDTGEPTDD